MGLGNKLLVDAFMLNALVRPIHLHLLDPIMLQIYRQFTLALHRRLLV